MTDKRSVPPVWNKVGRHGVFPTPRHDEIARFNFLTNMNMHLSTALIPGVREAYENRVEPAFIKENARPPESRHEVREIMSKDSFYQWWSALRRSTMEMRQQSGRSMVLRQINDLNAKAEELNNGAPTLKLNSTLTIPRYISSVDIHCMPGCYYTSLSDGDISAGANYDSGLFVTTAGLLGAYSDGGGKAIAEWLQKEQPQFTPRRILDIGCTIGHNIVPLALAFPNAEVIAVDCAEPVLRYGHARAKSMGVKNLTFIQANGEDLAMFEDGHFDLITTSMFLHETSVKSMPRILSEISRLLSTGGLSLHLEQPQYEGRPVFEQFMRDWDTYNNNEPFWGTMHDMDLVGLINESGLPTANQFEISIAAGLDETIFPKTETEGGKTEDYGRSPLWNVFGAWKPTSKEDAA